jgi:hypothetical protein
MTTKPACGHYSADRPAEMKSGCVRSQGRVPDSVRQYSGAADNGAGNLDTDYSDGRIEFAPDGLSIHGYYFPWGTKHIPYGSIRLVRRVRLSRTRGTGRIWGTANPGYWLNLDVRRPGKHLGFILDLGRTVCPLVTPDDPDGFEAALRQHHAGPIAAQTGRAPIV